MWYATTDNWYRAQTSVEIIQENQIAYLRFESINLVSDVWVNDNPVMIQHLGLFPLRWMLLKSSKIPKRRAESALLCRARNIVSNKPWLFYNGFQLSYYNPPQTSGNLGEDWNDQPWTGIAGEAVLDVLNRVHLNNPFIITEAIVDRRAALDCRINFRNTSWDRFQGKVRVEISPWLPT